MTDRLIHISEENEKFYNTLENMSIDHKKIGRITLKNGVKVPFVYIGKMMVEQKKSHIIKIILGD